MFPTKVIHYVHAMPEAVMTNDVWKLMSVSATKATEWGLRAGSVVCPGG